MIRKYSKSSRPKHEHPLSLAAHHQPRSGAALRPRSHTPPDARAHTWGGGGAAGAARGDGIPPSSSDKRDPAIYHVGQWAWIALPLSSSSSAVACPLPLLLLLLLDPSPLTPPSLKNRRFLAAAPRKKKTSSWSILYVAAVAALPPPSHRR
ncbi:hypothetical protein ABZP36_014296 [Zizania latifolia]